jgi:hypothetical protein
MASSKDAAFHSFTLTTTLANLSLHEHPESTRLTPSYHHIAHLGVYVTDVKVECDVEHAEIVK